MKFLKAIRRTVKSARSAAGQVHEPAPKGPEPVSKESEPVPKENGTAEINLPPWFHDNCVKTNAELKTDREVFLKLRSSAEHVDQSDTIVESKEQVDQDSVFEIESVVYEALHAVLSGTTRVLIPSIATPTQTKANASDFFSHDAMLLKLPDSSGNRGAPTFLRSVVKMFAAEVGADLITLSLDDLEDLAQYLFQLDPEAKKLGSANFDPENKRMDSRHLDLYFQEEPSDSTASDSKRVFPFSDILRAPISRHKDKTSQCSAAVALPLIVHLPEIHRFNDKVAVVHSLRDAIGRENQEYRRILAVSSSHALTRYSHDEILESMGTWSPVYVMPVKSAIQKILLEKGLAKEDDMFQGNLRTIQRQIREHKGFEPPILLPYITWDFLNGSKAAEVLSRQRLNANDVHLMANLICQDLTSENIKKVLISAERRNEIVSEWNLKIENDKWSGFPPNIRTTLEMIKNSRKYTWERQLLDLVVDPGTVQEGWADIEIDPDIRETITQMVKQPSMSGRSAHGVLKKGMIGGALLYGPPGTGKTHLARVLARECQVTMISVSTADIESKWVGDTEKAIKVLFSLGRMLAPSVIFIDEADGLFSMRQADDRPWERRRLNQLLTEMDGLVKLKTPPFVLLATNFPQQLDHAVLRRAPTKLHIGLPQEDARMKILNIYLRDERVAEDVDLRSVALRTEHFSGSDILTLCIQAALASESDASPSATDGVRVLERSHFETALMRTTPSVTEYALENIRQFAEKFDPWTWEKMQTAKRTSRDLHAQSSLVGDPSPGFQPASSRKAAEPSDRLAFNGEPAQLFPELRVVEELDSDDDDNDDDDDDENDKVTLYYFPMKPDIVVEHKNGDDPKISLRE